MAVSPFRNGAAICVCLVLLGGTPGGGVRAEAYPSAQIRQHHSALEQARAAMQQGHADEAIEHLKAWLASHPQDVNAKVMLADAYLAAHQSQQAEAELKAALEISPRSYQALLALGSLYAESGRLESAERLLAQAVREEPLSAVARFTWATVLSKRHEYSKAATALRRVPLPAAPDERIAYERLKASIDLGLGHAAEAAADMERALQLAPQDVSLQFATGVTESHAGHWSRAIQLLSPVFQSTQGPQVGLALLDAQVGAHKDFGATIATLRATSLPREEELSLRLSLAQFFVGHALYAEAAKDFRRAAALDPGRTELLYDLALAEYRAGQLDAALQSAQKAKAVQDSALIESLLGEIQENRGESVGAVRSYQAAVTLAPDREDYRLSLGMELLSHHTFKAALVVFRQGAELFPRSFRMRVALGLSYYLLQDYANAVKTLQDATGLGKDPAMAFDYLGSILLGQVDKPDAVAVKKLCAYADSPRGSEKAQVYCGALLARAEHAQGDGVPSDDSLRRLRKAATSAPEDSTARCELGKALNWAQQWTQARQELEACVRLDPDSVDGHYLLAGIYRRLGQKDLATKEIQLHQQAMQHMTEANELRFRQVKQFIVTMNPSSP